MSKGYRGEERNKVRERERESEGVIKREVEMWKRGQSVSGGRTSGVTCEEELPVRGMGDPRGARGHKGSRTDPGVLLVLGQTHPGGP